MEKTILIRNARAIVTCDAEDRVFYNADLLIQGPKIVKIGANLSDPHDEVIDASDRFVYPGLINTHHHFFQTFIRNLRTIDYPNMAAGTTSLMMVSTAAMCRAEGNVSLEDWEAFT